MFVVAAVLCASSSAAHTQLIASRIISSSTTDAARGSPHHDVNFFFHRLASALPLGNNNKLLRAQLPREALRLERVLVDAPLDEDRAVAPRLAHRARPS